MLGARQTGKFTAAEKLCGHLKGVGPGNDGFTLPNGQQGFFHKQWQSHTWRKIRMSDADGYKPEFECQFLRAPGAIFTYELFDRSLSEDILPLFPWEEQIKSPTGSARRRSQ